MARIGVLGGTFDPVHVGHLRLAEEARRKLALDRVLLVPAGRQPLKTDRTPAPAEDRLEMLRRAVAGRPGLEVSDIEVRRGGPGPTYTVDTLRALRAELGPDAEIFFLAGSDVLRDLDRWYRLDEILSLATFVVATRPGFPLEIPAALRDRLRTLEIDTIEAASTDVRARFAAGGTPADAVVPPPVTKHIREKGLYIMSTNTTPATAAIDTTIRKLPEHVGARVRLKGWLYNRRSKGKIHFLLVRDGSGIVQGVATRADVPEETFALMAGIPQEASIIVEGTVRKDDRAPGGVELTLHACEVVSRPEKDYPISIQDVSFGPDFLLERRHLWLRSQKQWATLRVRHEVEQAIHDFYYERGFTRVDAPILTPAACEGTTTLFELEYFEEGKAYLTQSGQLYSEAAAMAFGKVYCFGPTFRAERSKTRRHLTEFWMVEPEVAYATLDDVMQLAEDFICHIVKRVLERCRPELGVLERDVKKLEAIVPPFPRMSYDDAVKLLQSKGHKFEWGGDLGAPDETVISQAHDKPVMIHRYPREVKAFYMKRDPQDPRVALCVDVIAPEGVGEIIGGSQREDDLGALLERIREHKLPESAFEWYLDLRRFGSVPHGGFGLGIERTVAWICGREHIRESIPFPRMLYRIYP